MPLIRGPAPDMKLVVGLVVAGLLVISGIIFSGFIRNAWSEHWPWSERNRLERTQEDLAQAKTDLTVETTQGEQDEAIYDVEREVLQLQPIIINRTAAATARVTASPDRVARADAYINGLCESKFFAGDPGCPANPANPEKPPEE